MFGQIVVLSLGMRMGLAYIKYRTRAKNRHGVHSPFVYDFVENVLNKPEARKSGEIEELRSLLKADYDILTINDLGAGSRTSLAKGPTIERLARKSATPARLASMLQRLVDHYQFKTLLELGTNLGLTTAYLAASSSVEKVISIEGDPSLYKLAGEHLKRLQLNAELRCGDFSDTLPKAIQDLEQVDFAYIDGNHRKAPTLDYFHCISAATRSHSVIAIGDIHWSPGMEAAWEEIQRHPSVRTTIDLFYMGLVFFRKELTPEHFILRFP